MSDGPISPSLLSPQLFKLEDLRKQRLEDLATLIQKIYRGWKCRRHFLLMRRSQIVVAAWFRRFAVSAARRPPGSLPTCLPCCLWLPWSHACLSQHAQATHALCFL